MLFALRMSNRIARQESLEIVFFASMAAALFAPGIFSARIPIFRDLMALVIPLRRYAAISVGNGRLPLWIPDLFLGAPFLANYQSAVFYPISAILYWVPWPQGFSLFLAAHVLFGGWGMARYLRRRRKLPPEAALFGGAIFAFGGFFVSLVSLTNQLEVAAWLPWVLTAAEELRETGRLRAFLGLSAFLALQGLGGAPEAWIMTLGLLAADHLRHARESGFSSPRLWVVGAAALLAVALCSAQLLPTLEYVSRTNRAEALPFAAVASESLVPSSLLQFLLPHVFVDGAPEFLPEATVPLFWSLYVGIAPLVIVIAGLASRRPHFWTGVLAVSVLLALGANTPVLGLIYQISPRFIGLFRFPLKFFLLAHFALALIAADGLAVLREKNAITRVAVVAVIIAVLAAAASFLALSAPRLLLSVLGYELPADLSPSTSAALAAPLADVGRRSSGLALVVVGLLWLLARNKLTFPRAAQAVVLVTLVDLIAIHQPALVFTEWESLWNSGMRATARMEGGLRIFHYCTRVPSCLPEGASGLGPWAGGVRPGENMERQARDLWGALIPNLPILYGLGAVSGSDGLSTREQAMFYRALAIVPRDRAVQLLSALSVDRLVGPEPLLVPSLRELAKSSESSRWSYDLGQHAPRSYLADRVLRARDLPTALEIVASSDFRVGRDAVLMEGDGEVPPVSPGAVEETLFGAEEVTARVSLPGPGLWVLSDTYFPGWEAVIDGKPADVLRVNGLVRGLAIPAGRHHIVMSYRPRSFRIATWVSALAIIVFFAGVAAELIRRQRKPPLG